MLFRKAFPTLIGVAALLAAGGAMAAAAKSERPVVLASYYAMGDRAVDPMGESIRAILTNVGGQGDFVEKKDAGALTAFYRAQGYAPSWISGRQADRARSGGHRPHQGGRHRRPRPVRLPRAARPDRRRHAGHADQPWRAPR